MIFFSRYRLKTAELIDKHYTTQMYLHLRLQNCLYFIT